MLSQKQTKTTNTTLFKFLYFIYIRLVSITTAVTKTYIIIGYFGCLLRFEKYSVALFSTARQECGNRGWNRKKQAGNSIKIAGYYPRKLMLDPSQ